MIAAAGAWLWPRLRARPFSAAALAILLTPSLLAISLLSWDGLTWGTTRIAAWMRPPSIAEQCEAAVADARARGLTPMNYDNAIHRDTYWAEVLTTCVRTRIEGR